ncbi:putative serine/threonine-protein kinase drkD-like [Planoprotostelium fungivorum]|uniref:Putative serine/threonine-protein kinase drkD-like n=1 Tax=Planoprotostelium fungivorum TaxID=1890364 RepID=A0A2P6MQ00_9EUKA|nr:putative serine/threonine-protein kinase drkD-like [Planoprotostelium fungivorum]
MTSDRKFRHTNVVSLIGAITVTPGRSCLILEYLELGSLDIVLKNRQIELPWPVRVRMGLDAARGMAFVHKHGKVHRDLKSLNLLVDENYNVKIADFGETREAIATMTVGVGTFLWMAPEVITSQNYSFQADVFSMGVVLWELYTRQLPKRTMQDVNKGAMPPLEERCPSEWSKLVDRCCHINPAKRPTFGNLILELGEYRRQLTGEVFEEFIEDDKEPDSHATYSPRISTLSLNTWTSHNYVCRDAEGSGPPSPEQNITARRMYEAERTRGNQKKLAEIQDKIIGKLNLLDDPDRRFIREGWLNKLCRKSTKSRWFILLSDLFVHSSTTIQNKYVVHQVYKLAETRFEDIPKGEAVLLVVWYSYSVDSTNCSFQIVNNIKSFVVIASCGPEKVEWLRDCNLAVESLPTIIRNATVEAPIWQQDSDASSCVLCNSLFKLLNRRLKNLGSAPVRVCDECSRTNKQKENQKTTSPSIKRAVLPPFPKSVQLKASR